MRDPCVQVIFDFYVSSIMASYCLGPGPRFVAA